MHHFHLLSLGSLLLVVALWAAALFEGLAVFWGITFLARQQRESRQLDGDLRALDPARFRRGVVHSASSSASRAGDSW